MSDFDSGTILVEHIGLGTGTRNRFHEFCDPEDATVKVSGMSTLCP